MAERRRRPIPSDVRYKDIRDTYTLEIRINLVLGIILMIPLSFTLFLKISCNVLLS
jgi:hypothetical protein